MSKPVEMEPTKFHFCLSVSGAIRNKAFGFLIGDDGRELSRREGEAMLRDLERKGVEKIADQRCDNFDPAKGCLGHV